MIPNYSPVSSFSHPCLTSPMYVSIHMCTHAHPHTYTLFSLEKYKTAGSSHNTTHWFLLRFFCICFLLVSRLYSTISAQRALLSFKHHLAPHIHTLNRIFCLFFNQWSLWHLSRFLFLLLLFVCLSLLLYSKRNEDKVQVSFIFIPLVSSTVPYTLYIL